MFSEIDEIVDYAAMSEMDEEEKTVYLDGLAAMGLDLAKDKDNQATAYELLEFCAEEGCLSAAKNIVKLFDEGVTCIDKSSAEKYCAVAAFSGDAVFKERLKKGFANEPFIENLIKSQEPADKYALYNYYLQQGAKELAGKYFTQALEMGYKDALFDAYCFFLDKTNPFFNRELALYYLKEAAAAGHAKAKTILNNN